MGVDRSTQAKRHTPADPPYQRPSRRSLPERLADERSLLSSVSSGITFGRAGSLRPRDIHECDLWWQKVADLGQHELAGAQVTRLFLSPDDRLESWIRGDQPAQLSAGEWI